MNFKKQDTKLIYDYITTHAPTDMTMIDIGSRTGKWLVPYVTYFPDAEFHCIEALPDHFNRLKRRYRKDNNVFVYNDVVSNEPGSVTFYQDLDRAGWSGLRKHYRLENYNELTLQSKTVDSYNIDPYFIKIDVEGAELPALQGAVKTLQKTSLVYFECNQIHFQEYNYTANDLYDFLTENNFTIHSIITLDEISKDVFANITQKERIMDEVYESNFLAIK